MKAPAAPAEFPAASLALNDKCTVTSGPGDGWPEGVATAKTQELPECDCRVTVTPATSAEPLTAVTPTLSDAVTVTEPTCAPHDHNDPYSGVGETLPEMPLFLTRQSHVLVPLETTYQATWDACPAAIQKLLEVA